MGVKRGEKMEPCPNCKKHGLYRPRKAAANHYEPFKVCRYCGWNRERFLKAMSLLLRQ